MDYPNDTYPAILVYWQSNRCLSYLTTCLLEVTSPVTEILPELISTAQFAKLADYHEVHCRRLRKQGKGPPYLRLRPTLIRYRLADVLAWLAARDKGG